MFETVIVALCTSLVCSFAAHFVLHWEVRTRVRRIEWTLEEIEEKLLKDDRRRAAAASVASRRGGAQLTNAFDEAAVAAVTRQPAPSRQPWWKPLLERENGPKSQ